MESITFFSSIVNKSYRTCHLSFYNAARDNKSIFVFLHLSYNEISFVLKNSKYITNEILFR